MRQRLEQHAPRRRRVLASPRAGWVILAFGLLFCVAALPPLLLHLSIFPTMGAVFRRATRPEALRDGDQASSTRVDVDAKRGSSRGHESSIALDSRGLSRTAVVSHSGTGDRILVHTKHGNITIKFRGEAPQHVNFMRTLVELGRYDGRCWYRAERNFVLQGGLRNAAGQVFRPGLPSPPLEYALPNKRGFVNMARFEDPQSGAGDFCILLKDSPHLDRTGPSGYAAGFTVWGEVVDGMHVADTLSQGPVKNVDGLNFLVDPVTFESVSIL